MPHVTSAKCSTDRWRLWRGVGAGLLEQQRHNLQVIATAGPGDWCRPRLVVRMNRPRAARQKKTHHVGPAGARCPRQWSRLELAVAGVDVGTAIEQPPR